MDLLGLLKAVGHASELAKLARGDDLPDWASDEEAFLRHFGISHEDFMEIARHLSPEQAELLERTFQVNPEAAILWVLAMETVG